MLRILCVLLLCCPWLALRAEVPETPRLRVIGSAEGLPSTDIYAIARDRTGYVWIATTDGLARHDGVEMRVWRHHPDDPGSLPGNVLQAIHVDARDRIWVASQNNGMSMLDTDRRAFRHYRRADYPEMGSDEVFTIASHGDEVWFGSYEGLHRLDAQGRITRFAHDPEDPSSLPSNIVMSIAFDRVGTLWVATFGGLARFVDGRIERMPLPGETPAPLVYSVTLLGDDIWVGAGSGVFHTSGDGRWRSPSWAPMFERPNAIVAMARDREGGMWMGTQRRLWRLAPGSAIPVPVPLGGGVSAPVKALLLQDDGALWVPVYGSGIGYLRSDWRRVAQFTQSPGGLHGDRYRGIALANDGGVWLGAQNGVIERLSAQGVIERLEGDEADALLNARIFALAEDRDGRLWIGSRMGLTRIGGGTVDTWDEEDAVDALMPGTPNMLRFAADGTLWVCIQGYGVQQRDVATGRVLRNVPVGDESDNNWMEFSPEGELWTAGRDGMMRLARDGDRFEMVEGMQGRAVHAFAFDGPDVLWLQRITGLERYARSAGRWRRTDAVGVAEGLPALQGAGLRIDAQRRVWLSSTRGLYRWDRETAILRHYGVQHGLSSQEFFERALVLDGDGMLIGATNDGSVVLVDTVADDPPTGVPTLLLDSVSVRRGGEWQPLDPQAGIVLAAHEHEFRVTSRLLSYDDPLSNRYWSLLDGHDQDWVAQGASGERVFSGLRPGRHALRLRASDAAGNAAAEQRIVFEVLPPWWRTGWAMAGFALAAMLALWWMASAYRRRLKRHSAWQLAEHKRELAEQASLAKTRFLATLGHEVRTPMTGVLGMSELLLDSGLDPAQRGYAESIQRAGEHLMRLVNDALDLARIEADRLELDAEPFDLHALVHDAMAMTGPVARQRGLDFRGDLVDGTPQWLVGDAMRVRQILLNLLGNAIKFTERGHVSLRVEPLAPVGIRLIVDDTGPGLNAEQKLRLFRRFEQAEGARTATRYGGSGLGLAICQELAAAMGGRVDVVSEPGQGASFIVELPLAAAGNAIPAPRSRTPVASPPRRLLLVEDDPTVADVVSGLLSAQGHAVTHVGNGLAALSEIATHRFDLALLDLDLPGVDGLALARMMRDQGFVRPLLAITARADGDAEQQARDAGFVGFLRKPVTGALLAEAIAAACGENDPAA